LEERDFKDAADGVVLLELASCSCDAGLEEKPWSLENVVEMTQAYWLRKREIGNRDK
jgi:hypothetical protein